MFLRTSFRLVFGFHSITWIPLMQTIIYLATVWFWVLIQMVK